MKKLVFITVLGLFALVVTAQEYQYVPFPDSNAVWSEIFIKPWDEPAPRWEYNKYALFNEDTVINGMAYHKLFHTHSSEITSENSNCVGVIREDSIKKIWFKDFDSTNEYSFLNKYGEILLYNFNLQVNDTINNYKDFTNISPGSVYLVAQAIDTIKIFNTKRKVFTFSETPVEVWIEGIGKIRGLIFTSGEMPFNGLNNDLVCMHHNDTLMYYYSGKSGEYDDCVPQFVKDGVALLPNTEVKVYPNPATGGLVNFEGLDFETLELYDLNGKLIREEEIRGEDCYPLDVSNLPPGVYTYRLKTNGLVPTMGKIIVQ